MASKQLVTLQVGRGLATTLVVLYHASRLISQQLGSTSSAILGGIFDFGHASVIFFFVLSGFIIISAHRNDIGKPGRVMEYLSRRFVRVYPVYWIVLIPAVAIYALMPDPSKVVLTSPIVLAQGFTLFGENNQASLAVAWTLFHEMLFYSAFATLVLNRRAGFVILGLWFTTCAVLSFTDLTTSYHFNYLNLLFLAGMISFEMTSRYTIPRPEWVFGAGILAFLFLGMVDGLSPQSFDKTSTLSYGIASAVIVVGCVAMENSRELRIPHFLKLTGDASYSIYLIHFPLLSLLSKISIKMGVVNTLPIEISSTLLSIISLLAGIGFHLYVEKPLVIKARKMVTSTASDRKPAEA